MTDFLTGPTCSSMGRANCPVATNHSDTFQAPSNARTPHTSSTHCAPGASQRIRMQTKDSYRNPLTTKQGSWDAYFTFSGPDPLNTVVSQVSCAHTFAHSWCL